MSGVLGTAAFLDAARTEVGHYVGRVRRLNATQGQTIVQTGKAKIQIPGTGTTIVAAEATIDVTFWNPYTDAPLFVFGSELDPTQQLTAGSFPTVSAVVSAWTQPTPTTGGTVVTSSSTGQSGSELQPYTGATIGVVVSGPPGLVIWVTYQFTGTVIMMPNEQLYQAS